jgi:hypothetical protein
MRDDRYDVQVEDDGGWTIVVETAVGGIALHARPAGAGRFVSCKAKP